MSDGWLVKRELLVSDEIRVVALLALITACNNTRLAGDGLGTSGLQHCGQTHGHDNRNQDWVLIRNSADQKIRVHTREKLRMPVQIRENRIGCLTRLLLLLKVYHHLNK